jgi:hypothetical protein
LSDELVAWARAAGYALTPSDSTGAAVLWSDPGGEIRFYMRGDGDWFLLSRADRASNENLTISAPSVDTLERFLFDSFGSEIRTAKRLPWLRVPTTREGVAPGYDTVEDSDGYLELVKKDDIRVARGRGGSLGVMNLVLLSHLCSVPIADIEMTYLDASGRPLFPQHSS